MKPFTFYLDKAQGEVLQPGALRKIQAETAYTWTARACVAQQNNLYADAIEYAHEGIEHAALCGDENVLHHVRDFLARYNVRL